MQKISLQSYYEIGYAVRRAANIETEECEKSEAWIAALNVESGLSWLIGPQGPGLFVSFSHCARVVEAAKKVIQWRFDPGPDLDTEQRSELRYLQFQAKALEPVLLAELQTLPTYIVTKQGAYDSNSLVEHAEYALPEHVRERLPEGVLRDVQESGRCLVFDLPTASGLHMMRATEAVTQLYYLKTCNPDPPPEKGKSLGFYIKEFRESGNDHAKEMAELINQIREQHRNDLAHPNLFLKQEEAFTLFEIAKSAIIAMAEQLDVLGEDEREVRPRPLLDLGDL